MKVILVRHGETTANVDKLFCGHTDVDLTEKGIEQAYDVKERLKSYKIWNLYSSDLTRAVKTASIINEHHKVNMTEVFDLREMNFGEFEGSTYEEILVNRPEEAKSWREEANQFRFPNGESLIDVYERVNSAYRSIYETYKESGSEDALLIVAHAGVIRAILSSEIAGDINSCWKFGIDNCGVTILQYEQDFPILIGFNK